VQKFPAERRRADAYDRIRRKRESDVHAKDHDLNSSALCAAAGAHSAWNGARGAAQTVPADGAEPGHPSLGEGDHRRGRGDAVSLRRAGGIERTAHTHVPRDRLVTASCDEMQLHALDDGLQPAVYAAVVDEDGVLADDEVVDAADATDVAGRDPLRVLEHRHRLREVDLGGASRFSRSPLHTFSPTGSGLPAPVA